MISTFRYICEGDFAPFPMLLLYIYALEVFITITSSDFNLIINILTGLLPIGTFGAQTFTCILTLDSAAEFMEVASQYGPRDDCLRS